MGAQASHHLLLLFMRRHLPASPPPLFIFSALFALNAPPPPELLLKGDGGRGAGGEQPSPISFLIFKGGSGAPYHSLLPSDSGGLVLSSCALYFSCQGGATSVCPFPSLHTTQ